MPEATKPKKDDTPDYQKRVAVEHKDLTEKIDKLTGFLNDPENEKVEDRDVLARQLDVMRRYALILEQRIDRF